MTKDRFKLGPTGKFPDGKLCPEDKGEIAIGIGIDPEHKIIVMQFGIPTRFIGMNSEQAIEIADDLISKANMLDELKKQTKSKGEHGS